MGKKRHRPPSRINYEKNHPTVSFRVEKNLYDRLKSLLQKKNQSIADFFKINLNEQEEDYDFIYSKGYTKGYDVGKIEGNKEGYTKGMNNCSIWVNCWKCHKPIYIKPNSNEHLKINEIMDGYFRHPECSND